ncbi:MAG: hypothetical protein ACR2MZ_00980 [Candidatus Dormibacter sp.]|uniref:hypothetical protein n=1 Tax=Candidatus Dormibacter sp. TaxID=2973982 RepID=UPI000DB23061|nr:MAG: hypothetical protein DLM66_09435 [Candidatus Dormibacteraeota bacterium]
MAFEVVIEEVLVYGLDDWVMLSAFTSVVSSELGINDWLTVRPHVLTVMRTVLAEGWYEVGNVGEDGFHSWRLPLEDSLQRLEAEVLSLESWPHMGDPWFNLTPAGQEEAERIVRRTMEWLPPPALPLTAQELLDWLRSYLARGDGYPLRSIVLGVLRGMKVRTDADAREMIDRILRELLSDPDIQVKMETPPGSGSFRVNLAAPALPAMREQLSAIPDLEHMPDLFLLIRLKTIV